MKWKDLVIVKNGMHMTEAGEVMGTEVTSMKHDMKIYAYEKR